MGFSFLTGKNHVQIIKVNSYETVVYYWPIQCII